MTGVFNAPRIILKNLFDSTNKYILEYGFFLTAKANDICDESVLISLMCFLRIYTLLYRNADKFWL